MDSDDDLPQVAPLTQSQVKVRAQQIILATINVVIMQNVAQGKEAAGLKTLSFEQFASRLEEVEPARHEYTVDLNERGVMHPKFDLNMVNVWAQQITDISLCQLVNMCQPFKWIINCIIMQATPRDGQWTEAQTAYWDKDSDLCFQQQVDFTREPSSGKADDFQVSVTCFAMHLGNNE